MTPDRAGDDRFCDDCDVSKDLHPSGENSDAFDEWECEVAGRKAALLDRFGGLLYG